MFNARRQQGKALVAWLIVLAITVLVSLRLFPIYLESFNVQSVLKSLKDEQAVGERGVAEIREGVLRRFQINNVKNARPEDIVISREGNWYIVDVDYQVRTHFVGNVDFVVSFENSVEVAAR